MTVISTLRNADFNNPNLPIVSPIIAKGLLAAFRPSTTNPMTDVSGNRVAITKVGNPIYTRHGVIGSIADGFVTSLSETRNHTIIVAARCTAQTSPFLCGTFNGQTKTGTGVFALSGDSAMRIDGVMWLQGTSEPFFSRADGPLIPPATFATLWNWMAFTVDTDNSIAALWLRQGTAALSRVATIESPGVAARPMDATKKIRVMGPQPLWDYPGKGEVAEVLIYDRVLTDEEIARQYAHSSSFLANERGIVL